ncbi:hypothetical protein [Amycolatopsis sp. FDAARGOS 1241]|uniref:hypothetical protein n=1 Tax=Amycolatopsis sp. FDAARGOS 1241 TaxID=2778070 RepID=UPI00194EA8DC|nr:hypothetical protein [Amycolatopsis sp. FDAARGOS 1241]QRP50351.1 hypothetical protein I6J71_23270 [Amycolatopsis sp. FDAARGOS 1241]
MTAPLRDAQMMWHSRIPVRTDTDFPDIPDLPVFAMGEEKQRHVEPSAAPA